jgi:hypothetical protein
MLDQNSGGLSAGSTPSRTRRLSLEESPLAGQLPEWDLAPAHTLLLRRRSAAPPAAAKESEPPAAPPAPAARPIIATPAAPPAPEPACGACGAKLEPGAGFCEDCGARV